ncbi:DNA repair exonuclease [Leptospira ognonensis]|uniref:DNA repair exonuclease n=2 Tax=Leptospira ognonensis TaxID=2484945 RepID=A0A4R9K995_9LEPT|nr:DNA repair exonuclease [Leptospira ognonensis]
MNPMKLIQFSDLHLSASNDPEYCLDVLTQIVTKATDHSCHAIILCGDVFDTYADMLSLRSKFITILTSFGGKVYFLPGNHESLRRNTKERSFPTFDWGNQITFLDQGPYQILPLNEEVELLSIPHQESYGELLMALPPKKMAKVRIALAHATVVGMSFTGLKDEEEEEKGGLIDVTQLQSLDCDYVAVGHIHSARSQKFGKMEVAYAGSARVWRSGETGPRKGILLDISNSQIHKTEVILEKAGIYAEVVISLGLDGMPEKSAEDYLSVFSNQDWIRIKWQGVVESMKGKMEFQAALKANWQSKFRRLEFDTDESEIIIAENLLENAFIQNFVKVMDAKKDGMEISEWSRAKELGLKLLLEVQN